MQVQHGMCRRFRHTVTGLNGVDYTIDDGKTFSLISTESYHVCRKAKKGKAVYFAGGGGRIGKLILQ